MRLKLTSKHHRTAPTNASSSAYYNDNTQLHCRPTTASSYAHYHNDNMQLHQQTDASSYAYDSDNRVSNNKLMVAVSQQQATPHTADLCQPVGSVGSRQRLRSATRSDLVISPTIMHFGARSFAIAGPKAWNQLPADMRAIDSVNSFKCALKTFLFR